jgi:hypothetical protein
MGELIQEARSREIKRERKCFDLEFESTELLNSEKMKVPGKRTSTIACDITIGIDTGIGTLEEFLMINFFLTLCFQIKKQEQLK